MAEQSDSMRVDATTVATLEPQHEGAEPADAEVMDNFRLLRRRCVGAAPKAATGRPSRDPRPGTARKKSLCATESTCDRRAIYTPA